MVNIDQQHQVDPSRGQLRVDHGAEHRLDVANFCQGMKAMSPKTFGFFSANLDCLSICSIQYMDRRMMQNVAPIIDDSQDALF